MRTGCVKRGAASVRDTSLFAAEGEITPSNTSDSASLGALRQYNRHYFDCARHDSASRPEIS